MNKQTDGSAKLTKNQKLVFDELSASPIPLSAYALLDNLRSSGFRAPLQVYRALEKLIEFDLVHKLESRNAFVVCQHPDCARHNSVAFTICDSCDTVNEITDQNFINQLDAMASEVEFEVAKSTVELHGTCDLCRKSETI